jgi:hypothetical protein
MRRYAREDAWLARQHGMNDPLYQRPVRLRSVPALVGAYAGPGSSATASVTRARLEAEELDVDAFLRELDSWAESEDHQPAVVQARA